MENEEIKYNGIAEDPRTPEEKAMDYQHEELFSGAPEAIWEEREPRKYPIFNQDGSSACVANAVAKILGMDEIVESRAFCDLSRRDIYVRRANTPGLGMYLPNALAIAKNHGATLESLVTSEFKGEVDMNKWDGITPETDAIALQYRCKNYVELPIDIDAIAAITTQGKGVLLGFRFDADEWTDVPTVNPNSKQSLGHGVAGVDNILGDVVSKVKLVKGKKYLVIDDSWGPKQAKHGQRFISEEFLKARCFYAGYTINLILDEEPAPEKKPQHTFNFWMKRGEKNGEVVWLQDCLKYLGLFPKNTNSTGLYGAVTQKAVFEFQKKYVGIHNKGVQVGPKTLQKLNEMFS